MKKVFLGTLFFILGCGLANAAPNFKGYKDFIKENKDKIKAMEKECDNYKNPKERGKKCTELMRFRVEAECRFGINPDACNAIEEIKKIEKKTK